MKKYLLLLLAVVLILFAFYIGRQMSYFNESNTLTIDYIRAQKKVLQKQIKEQQFYFEQSSKIADSQIAKLKAEKELYKKQAKTITQKAKDQVLKQSNDSCISIALVNELIADHDQYTAILSAEIEASDSIITFQDSQIIEQKSLIHLQSTYIQQADFITMDLTKQIEQMKKEAIAQSKKIKRQKTWSKIKMALGFGAGILISSKL